MTAEPPVVPKGQIPGGFLSWEPACSVVVVSDRPYVLPEHQPPTPRPDHETWRKQNTDARIAADKAGRAYSFIPVAHPARPIPGFPWLVAKPPPPLSSPTT